MQPNASALGQQRAIFKKFMENLLAKSSKLRALVKELNKKYCDASESTMYEPQHEQKSLRSIMQSINKTIPATRLQIFCDQAYPDRGEGCQGLGD